jgi:copper transport protein
MARLLQFILAAMAALLLLPVPAAAHAGLVRAEPAAGSMLVVPPQQIVLEFTERLDPTVSRLQLLDDQGRLLTETTTVDPKQPVRLQLEPGPLPRGSYTAVWRVRSAEDGHVTEGVVPFGVGVAANLAIILPAPGVPAPALALPPLTGALGRLLSLVGAGLAVGSIGFGLLVWRRAWQAARTARKSVVCSVSEADAQMGVALGRLTLAGAILVCLAAPLIILDQVQSLGGSGGGPVAALLAVLTSPAGLLVGSRVLVAAALATCARRLTAPGAGSARSWWAALLIGMLVLLTFTASGHSGAAGALAPGLLLLGLAHLIAMALWLGGLPGLLVAVRRTALADDDAAALAGWPALPVLVEHFSTVAATAVAALMLSGTAAAVVHVGSPELLTTTTYGRALLVKGAALVGLLGLGALHLLVVGPQLRPGGPWAGRFRVTLGVELALALVVLAAAATQITTAPSRVAWAAQERLGQRIAADFEDVGLVLWVTPGQVGDNLLALDVADARVGPGDPVVLFRAAMPRHIMAPLEVEGTPTGAGRYTVRGSFLSMAGTWEIETIVRRSSMPDVRHTFVVKVSSRQDGQ